MPTGEVLLELVVTAATFKPFKQILTVCILNNRSLVHACQTLKDTTAGTSILLINVDNCVSLGNIIAFDARSVLAVLLTLAHPAGVVMILR